MEEFRKIDGIPKYSISEHGSVRNDITGRILKTFLDRNGYLIVNLPGVNLSGGKRKSVHRLVANAFCENPNNFSHVDHIDRKRKNNHFSNLRWISRSNNRRNAKKSTGCTSRFIGVTFNKKTNRWQAHLTIDGKLKHLGCFDTELKAAKARRQAIIENHLEEFYPPDEDCVTSPN